MGQLWIEAKREGHVCTVMVRDDQTGEGHELPMRTDLIDHSPTGFEWGYGGSGPAQLALAILVEAIPDGYVPHDKLRQHLSNCLWTADDLWKETLAMHLHQHFKEEVIAGLTEPAWRMSLIMVNEWIAKKVKDLGLAEDG